MKDNGKQPELFDDVRWPKHPSETEAYARSSDPQPSHDAAQRVSATALEAKVYKTLKECGTRMTSLGVSSATGIRSISAPNH
jgi:hypothetical protein